MRKSLCAVLALCLICLTACQKAAPLPPEDLPAPPDKPQTVDTYTLTELTGGGGSTAREDGEEISHYSYRLCQMETPENASEAAQGKAAVFNAKMTELQKSLEESGRSLADDAKAMYAADMLSGSCLTEDTEAAVTVMGDILSIRIDGSSYNGGAHPNTYYYSYVFDWDQGMYINPVEAAGDPEQFRAAVTDLLLDRIMGLDEKDGYFTGYEDAVSRWNEYCAVFRDTGLEVTFSAYELGPYALGPQVFLLTYGELSDALGEAGLARLGLAA